MALALQPSHNTWEETIVPTLRKRLEQESRILENRLSIHSLEQLQQSPRAPSTSIHAVSPRKQQSSRSPTPSQYPTSISPVPRNYSDTYRPSAIPRPSTSMAREFPTSTSSTDHRPASAASANKGRAAHPPVTRTRTRSTPYPFDPDGIAAPSHPTGGRKTPNGHGKDASINGMPTPASSRANSPMVGGPPKPSDPKPSRIPMRKRARSSSNATSMEGGTGGRYKKSAAPVQEVFPPSPETSPDIWRDQQTTPEAADLPASKDLNSLHPSGVDKIRDEAPIFNANRLSRATSFEEREFEHWYRGEGRDGGGRNGGRGEIKVAKAATAKEMMDIAVGGHVIGGTDRWTRRRAEQMDYVPDETELTDMEREEYSENVHTTEDDLHDYYYVGGATSSSSHPDPEPVPLPTPAPSTSRAQSPTVSQDRHGRSSLQKSRGPSSIPVPPTNPRKSSATSTATVVPSTPSKTRAQSRPRQRAVSRPQATPAYDPALADALPPWATRSPVPKDGNWDDVVLPTVAKKMGLAAAAGLDDDISMLGTPSKDTRKDKTKSIVYEPAPGTFAWDATKRRERPTGTEDVFGAPPPSTPIPISPVAEMKYEYPPSGKESPPPFAAYLVEHPEQTPAPAPAPAPVDQKARNKEMRKSRPAIVVTSPSELAKATARKDTVVDHEEGAGCCKCTIM